jgi:hypothetical protein
MAPQRGRGDQQSSQWPTYVNAVEFYDAAITKYHDNRP